MSDWIFHLLLGTFFLAWGVSSYLVVALERPDRRRRWTSLFVAIQVFCLILYLVLDCSFGAPLSLCRIWRLDEISL